MEKMNKNYKMGKSKFTRMLARTCAVSMIFMMILVMSIAPASAYIERGDVTISGSDNCTLEAGGTAQLNVTPFCEQHYPGCQMAECPTICGEKDCIVYVNGSMECVCAGTELVTYYAQVETSSSNNSVATASYNTDDGTITISGVGAGTAEITLKASFREYNDATKTVAVTVSGSGTSSPSTSGSESESGGSTPSVTGSGITGSAISGSAITGSAVTSSGAAVGATGSAVTSSGAAIGTTGSAVTSGAAVETTGSSISNEGNSLGTTSFSDVSGWAEPYITYLSERGIVNGKTATTFAPEDNITRAEFVKIMAGVAGANTSSYTTSSFSDVSASAWYSQYVAWAAAEKIVTGNDGRFYPDDKISRQDMAVIIYRYVQNTAGKTLPLTNEKINFADADSIALYASEAVSNMQQAGIVSGKGNDMFAPSDNATRAEACKMLATLMQIIG